MAVSINFLTLLALVAMVKLPPMAATAVFLNGSAEVLRRDRLVDQLRSLLGYGQHFERRVVIEELLRPTFMALPKDSRGTLDRRAARSALHRYFVVEYGWQIDGLSLEVPEQRTSPPAAVLKSRMPSLVMYLLEEQIGGDRIGLDDLVLLASLIEDVVHSSAVDLLSLAYKSHNLSKAEPLDAGQADLMIRTFMFFYRFPWTQTLANDTSGVTNMVTEHADEIYSELDMDMMWVEDLKQSLAYQGRSSLRPASGVTGQQLDFSSATSLVEEIVAGFGKFTNLECSWIKNSMMDLGGGEHEDGRVPLGNFYDPFSSEGEAAFGESPAYLRHLGALDERNPQQPSVIIPNLIYSRSNCITTTGFQLICCLDACEVLMSNLEKQVSQPTASPALIAAVVSAMPSDTVVAPRILPAFLLSKLDTIAGRHGGSVHLHSRLFAQWMHYAFPNECTYPRSLLTSEVQSNEEVWVQQTKTTSKATEQEKNTAKEQWEDIDQTVVSDGLVQLWSEDEGPLSDLVVPEHDILNCLLSYFANAFIMMLSVSALLEFLRAGRDEGLDKIGSVSERTYSV